MELTRITEAKRAAARAAEAVEVARACLTEAFEMVAAAKAEAKTAWTKAAAAKAARVAFDEASNRVFHLEDEAADAETLKAARAESFAAVTRLEAEEAKPEAKAAKAAETHADCLQHKAWKIEDAVELAIDLAKEADEEVAWAEKAAADNEVEEARKAEAAKEHVDHAIAMAEEVIRLAELTKDCVEVMKL